MSYLSYKRYMLSAFSFDKKELAEIAVHIVDSCFAEKKSREFESERYGKPIRPFEQCFSNYVYDSLKLLLRYGYDPNVSTDDDNAMFNLQYIDYPDIGAKTLRLLLENGGNPNVTLPDDPNEGMYDYLTSCISYDSYEHEYADRARLRTWIECRDFYQNSTPFRSLVFQLSEKL